MKLTKRERERLSPNDDPELIEDVAEALMRIKDAHFGLLALPGGSRLEVVQARRVIQMVRGTGRTLR